MGGGPERGCRAGGLIRQHTHVCTSGIWAGMRTVRWFGSRTYDWSGLSQERTLAGKARRSLQQLGPYSWDAFDWRLTASPRRFLQCLLPVAVILLMEARRLAAAPVLVCKSPMRCHSQRLRASPLPRCIESSPTLREASCHAAMSQCLAALGAAHACRQAAMQRWGQSGSVFDHHSGDDVADGSHACR